MQRGRAQWISMVAGVVLTLAGAHAAPISVGSGANQAEVWLEFGDGAMFTFQVAFDDATTGLGLFDVIEDETTLTTVRQDFGFGVFIDGISFDGHSNVGFGGGEDWWHYWTAESDDPAWTAPLFGVSDRVVEDGDADGWVYGRAGPPVPEPTSLTLLLVGAALVSRPTRRRPVAEVCGTGFPACRTGLQWPRKTGWKAGPTVTGGPPVQTWETPIHRFAGGRFVCDTGRLEAASSR